MKDRPTFFAFYPADFANDINVEAMSTLQVGAYILLLCKAWQADPPASLPNDDAILARLARLSPDEWSEVKAGVLSVFSLGTDDRWHQKRLRQEYEKAKALMKLRSKAGTAGANSRWQTHDTANANAMRTQCERNAIQNGDLEEDLKKNKDSEKSKSAARPPVFKKPTLEEVAEYCRERGNTIDPQRFMDYYDANGWKVGRSPMKDWRAAVRNWEKNEAGRTGKSKLASDFNEAAQAFLGNDQNDEN